MYANPTVGVTGGLAALIEHWGVVNPPVPNAPAAMAGFGVGCSTDAVQGLIFDGLVNGFSVAMNSTNPNPTRGSLSAANIWTGTQSLDSGLNWEAGPSEGTPGSDLAGGFLYHGDASHSCSRNWLLTGDVYEDWGDFGLFVSETNTGNPSLARYYHDGIANATTIGHNTTSRPTGTDTLNVEGTTAFVPPQITTTNGSPKSRIVVLGKQTTNNSATELTMDGGTPGSANRVVLDYHSTSVITVSILGRATSGGASKYAVYTVFVNGDGSALGVSSTNLCEFHDSGASGWGGFSFDDDNNVLQIKATGASSTTINWSARVEITEVSDPPAS